VRSAFVFENVTGPESNETLIFGSKKEFEQFIELVVTEIFDSVSIIVPFYFMKNLPLLSTFGMRLCMSDVISELRFIVMSVIIN
jgi:hypothetical protein